MASVSFLGLHTPHLTGMRSIDEAGHGLPVTRESVGAVRFGSDDAAALHLPAAEDTEHEATLP